MANKIRTAVVTGRHPFDVLALHHAFRSISDADVYIQHMEDWCMSTNEVRGSYQVVVFYNMHTELPGEDAPWWESPTRAALDELGRTRQGIFVLHHALLAYPNWPVWSEIVGIQDRSFGYKEDLTLTIKVANPDHPITRGVSDWTMVDETYAMADAGEGSEILLTVDDPTSMRTIGWVRQYGESRVFCLQSGHDDKSLSNSSLREVIAGGIRWCAGR